MPAGAASAEELRRLITLLESRGLTDRPEARALLDRSRRLLAAMPAPRPAPSLGGAMGKLGLLLRLAIDAAAAMAFVWGLAQLLAGAKGGVAVLALAGPLLWLLLRLNPGLEAWHEGALVLRYHLRWAADWFAEAVSAEAAHRIEARLVARRLMRGWRARRANLPAEPTLAMVRDWLAEAYGAHVGAAFGQQAGEVLRQRGLADASAAQQGGEAQRHSRLGEAARLRSLRWSALIEQFAALAASGALWAPPQRSAPLAEAPPPPPPPEPAPPDTAAQDRRRKELLELLRKKRLDLQTAYGWKLKTPAEIEQRDSYQNELRQQIAAHEKELQGLGVVAR
jgi:hypothetical protein